MIKRRTRQLNYLNNKDRKQVKYYKGKKHIRIIDETTCKGFHNTNTGDSWLFQKLHPGASPASIRDDQLILGLPTMTQVCYPGQTIRINSGWQTKQIPQTSMMYTYPSQYLLGADVVGVTQIYGQGAIDGELTTTLLNSGTQPIVFEINVVQSIFNVYRIDQQGLLAQDLSDFNWGEFLSAAVTTAIHILPIFI